MEILIAIVDKYNLKQNLLFMDRKESKAVIRPSLSVIYCHFRFCCVWARALPRPPGKPQHSTAALKETRRCCHHERVGSKVLTYGQSYLERLVRRTEAGRWPRWFPGSLSEGGEAGFTPAEWQQLLGRPKTFSITQNTAIFYSAQTGALRKLQTCDARGQN